MKIAVIGTGIMGRNHARIFADMNDVELVAVVDANEAISTTVAERYGTKAYSNVECMLQEQKPDAVSIAVPTSLHAEVARAAATHGCAMLVEKPIAGTTAEAKQIIADAKNAGVLLMIGHIERFNPVVEQLKLRLERGELGKLHELEARRQGPFPPRITDAGVVIDLAVHDIDVMSYITGATVDRLYAETKRCLHDRAEDIMSATLHLSENIIATLCVNWITPTKIRELSVTGEAGTFHVNYLTQDLTFFENAKGSSSQWETMDLLRGVSEGNMIRYQVQKEEPLRREIASFMQAVVNGGPSPVTGEDGLRALQIAELLLESGKTHAVITL